MTVWAESSLGIIIPAAEPRQCRRCTLCEMEFPMEQKARFIQHLETCSRRNEDVIGQTIQDNTESDFQSLEDTWEMIERMRQVGSRDI